MEASGNGNTLAYRVQALETQATAHAATAAPALQMLTEHEEQINGKRGIQVAIDEVKEEVRNLRRATWLVGAAVVGAAVVQTLLSGTGQG
jgi:hypothetical protein